jgi:hypothetical protein
MASDTALLFLLTHGGRDAVVPLAKDALVHLPERPSEPSFLLERLAGATCGMPGSGASFAAVGTIAKSPEVDGIIAALSPFLERVFLHYPDGRALVYSEGFEASGPGALVTELFLSDEETRGSEAPRIEMRNHVLPLGLHAHGEWPGSEQPESVARARESNSIAIMLECDDESTLAEPARRAAAQIRSEPAADALTREFVLEYLDELSARPSSTANVGPKGGLALWARAGRRHDVIEFVRLTAPFFREVTAGLSWSGTLLFFQDQNDAASTCWLGFLSDDDGEPTEYVARYHDTSLGLHWAPSLLVR